MTDVDARLIALLRENGGLMAREIIDARVRDRRESPKRACSFHDDSDADRCGQCEAQGLLPG